MIDPSIQSARNFLTKQDALDAALLWIHETSEIINIGHCGFKTWTGHVWNPEERSFDVNPILYGSGKVQE